MNALFIFCVFNRVVKFKLHTSVYTREGIDNKKKSNVKVGIYGLACKVNYLTRYIHTTIRKKRCNPLHPHSLGDIEAELPNAFFSHLHLNSSPHMLSTNINPRVMRVHK